MGEVPLFKRLSLIVGVVPITVPLFQLNSVPTILVVGSKLNVVPEQITTLVGGFNNTAFGFTVTFIVCSLLHPFKVKVNLYTTSIGKGVSLIKISLIFPILGESSAELEMPGTAALVHFKTALVFEL